MREENKGWRQWFINWLGKRKAETDKGEAPFPAGNRHMDGMFPWDHSPTSAKPAPARPAEITEAQQALWEAQYNQHTDFNRWGEALSNITRIIPQTENETGNAYNDAERLLGILEEQLSGRREEIGSVKLENPFADSTALHNAIYVLEEARWEALTQGKTTVQRYEIEEYSQPQFAHPNTIGLLLNIDAYKPDADSLSQKISPESFKRYIGILKENIALCKSRLTVGWQLESHGGEMQYVRPYKEVGALHAIGIEQNFDLKQQLGGLSFRRQEKGPLDKPSLIFIPVALMDAFLAPAGLSRADVDAQRTNAQQPPNQRL